MLGLIDKLRDAGRDYAAFDLAGKFFGADFENKLREGVDLTRRLRENLDSNSPTAGGQRVIAPEEIEKAQQLDTKLTDIRNTFATALIPIQRDASDAALDIYNHFLDFEGVLGRVAIVASNLYVQLRARSRARSTRLSRAPAGSPHFSALLRSASSSALIRLARRPSRSSTNSATSSAWAIRSACRGWGRLSSRPMIETG